MAKQPGPGQEGFVFSLGKVTKRDFSIHRHQTSNLNNVTSHESSLCHMNVTSQNHSTQPGPLTRIVQAPTNPKRHLQRPETRKALIEPVD